MFLSNCTNSMSTRPLSPLVWKRGTEISGHFMAHFMACCFLSCERNRCECCRALVPGLEDLNTHLAGLQSQESRPWYIIQVWKDHWCLFFEVPQGHPMSLNFGRKNTSSWPKPNAPKGQELPNPAPLGQAGGEALAEGTRNGSSRRFLNLVLEVLTLSY